MKAFILRNVYEPLYYRLMRNEARFRHYDTYRAGQWNTLEENRRLQKKRIFALVRYASENIPYYMKVIPKGITEENLSGEFRKIPALTKEILRREHDALKKITPGPGWYLNSSGGSTGEPAVFVQDKEYRDRSDAMKRIFKEWAGYRTGEAFIKLWGSESDLYRQKENFRKRLLNWMYGIELLNSFSMSPERMMLYVKAINSRKPKLIYAYAQSMNELSRFIESSRLRVHSPRSIMTSANILTPEYRKTIERVFRCPVFNLYGSREVGDIACECGQHNGLHLNIFTHYVEILDSGMQPCAEGQTGYVHVTLLTNFTMPLIRYRIGDMASFSDRECACGRGMPMISEIAGRDNDMFMTKDRRLIHTGILNMQFYFKGFIRKYQAVQEKPDRISIKVCLSESAAMYDVDAELGKIKANLKRIFGDDCEILFTVVDDIPSTPSGKYRYTIREF